MARYQKVLPMVDSQANTFAQIHQLLTAKKFKYENQDGQPVFRRGDGFWVVARYIKVTYYGNQVRVEAWVNNTGVEMDLEGFFASTVKKPLKKIVAQVEEILTRPTAGFVPQENAAPIPAVTEERPVLPAGITKKEYLKNYAGADFQRQLKSAAILGYVCAGINAAASILLFSPLGILESLIFLGLTLGMHLGKSKGCAIGMAVYAGLSVLLGIVLYGTFGGWLWLLAGIFAVQVFRTAEKRFKELTA